MSSRNVSCLGIARRCARRDDVAGVQVRVRLRRIGRCALRAGVVVGGGREVAAGGGKDDRVVAARVGGAEDGVEVVNEEAIGRRAPGVDPGVLHARHPIRRERIDLQRVCRVVARRERDQRSVPRDARPLHVGGHEIETARRVDDRVGA